MDIKAITNTSSEWIIIYRKAMLIRIRVSDANNDFDT